MYMVPEIVVLDVAWCCSTSFYSVEIQNIMSLDLSQNCFLLILFSIIRKRI